MVVFGKSSRSKYPRIEWLRTESNGLLHPPVNQEVPSIARETSSDSIDFNDIPESGPESETEAICANCVAPCSATVKLRACGHWLCGNCSSSTWQVYSSQGSHPRCPLPTCRTLATRLGDCTLELWLKVSKHKVTTRFQDRLFVKITRYYQMVQESVGENQLADQDSIVFCPRCEDRGMDRACLHCICNEMPFDVQHHNSRNPVVLHDLNSDI